MDPATQVDDPIDAFAVHGAAGAWGVLAAALFDWGNGVAPGARWRFLGEGFGVRKLGVSSVSSKENQKIMGKS